MLPGCKTQAEIIDITEYTGHRHEAFGSCLWFGILTLAKMSGGFLR